MRIYNYIDFFHGVFGFSLGAYWAGMKFKNHFCSDIEPYAVELQKKRFPDSIQLGDITKIDLEKLKKDYPGEWILTGGSPCQDISNAGKGKGLIDEKGNKTRSGLWFDYWRAIRILQPRFAIIENVRALLNRGLSTFLSNLAEIGFDAEWQIISAEDMGAPHKRERVWIVAYPGCWEQGQSSDPNKMYTDSPSSGLQERKKSKQQKSVLSIKRGGSKISHSLRNRLQGGSEVNINKKIESQKGGTVRRKYKKKIITNPDDTATTRQRKNGRKIFFKSKTKRFDFDNSKKWWAVEPSICRMVNGLSNELDGYQGRLTAKSYKRVDKLKGLGNSIVPQIAELLFRQIKDCL